MRDGSQTTQDLRKSSDWDVNTAKRKTGRRVGGSVPVLDTDILTIVQRGSGPAYKRLTARLSSLPADSLVWVTILSFEEQMRGWLEYVKRGKPHELPTRYTRLQDLYADYNTRLVLPFDKAAADVYERLLHARTRVGAMDLRIAAIVIARDELLISANVQHFRRIPGLRVEDWTR